MAALSTVDRGLSSSHARPHPPGSRLLVAIKLGGTFKGYPTRVPQYQVGAHPTVVGTRDVCLADKGHDNLSHGPSPHIYPRPTCLVLLEPGSVCEGEAMGGAGAQ